MLEILISSSALIVLLTVLRFVLKHRFSPRLRYALWLLVALRLLIPGSLFSLSFSLPALAEESGLTQTVEEVRYTTEHKTTYGSAPGGYHGEQILTMGDTEWFYREDWLGDPDITEVHIVDTQEVTPAEANGNPESDAAYARLELEITRDRFFALRVIRYGGMVLMALWFLFTNLRFRVSLRKHALPAGVDAPLPVRVAPGLISPCLCGLFRPVIYVTPACVADENRLRHILAHEYTHYRQGDQFWSLVRCACLVVWWFNPLVWLAAALSRRDCELACDEGAIARLGEGERIPYGRTLVDMVAATQSPAALLHTATTMTGGKKSIAERVALIAKRPKTTLLTLVTVAVLVVFAAACAFGGADKTEEPDQSPAGSVEEQPTQSDAPAGPEPSTGLDLTWEFPLPHQGIIIDTAFPIDIAFPYDHWDITVEGGAGYAYEGETGGVISGRTSLENKTSTLYWSPFARQGMHDDPATALPEISTVTVTVYGGEDERLLTANLSFRLLEEDSARQVFSVHAELEDTEEFVCMKNPNTGGLLLAGADLTELVIPEVNPKILVQQLYGAIVGRGVTRDFYANISGTKGAQYRITADSNTKADFVAAYLMTYDWAYAEPCECATPTTLTLTSADGTASLICSPDCDRVSFHVDGTGYLLTAKHPSNYKEDKTLYEYMLMVIPEELVPGDTLAQEYLSRVSDEELFELALVAAYPGKEFSSPTELTSYDLFTMAVLTADKAAWYDGGSETWRIPVADLTAALDGYFTHYTFQPTESGNGRYDALTKSITAYSLDYALDPSRYTLTESRVTASNTVQVTLSGHYTSGVTVTLRVTEAGTHIVSCVNNDSPAQLAQTVYKAIVDSGNFYMDILDETSETRIHFTHAGYYPLPGGVAQYTWAHTTSQGSGTRMVLSMTSADGSLQLRCFYGSDRVILNADGKEYYLTANLPGIESHEAALFSSLLSKAEETLVYNACAGISVTGNSYEQVMKNFALRYGENLASLPGWTDHKPLDVAYNSSSVSQAYFGEGVENFCGSLSLYFRLEDGNSSPWQAGAGMEQITEGEYAGWWRWGMGAHMAQSEDGTWRCTGLYTGGELLTFPVYLELASMEQLVYYFYHTTGGQAHDYNIPYAICSRPADEVEELARLLSEQEDPDALLAALYAFVFAYGDYSDVNIGLTELGSIEKNIRVTDYVDIPGYTLTLSESRNSVAILTKNGQKAGSIHRYAPPHHNPEIEQGQIQFENGEIARFFPVSDHTVYTDHQIIDGCAAPATIALSNYDPPYEDSNRGTDWVICFAEESGYMHFRLRLDDTLFTKEEAMELARSITFTGNAFLLPG